MRLILKFLWHNVSPLAAYPETAVSKQPGFSHKNLSGTKSRKNPHDLTYPLNPSTKSLAYLTLLCQIVFQLWILFWIINQQWYKNFIFTNKTYHKETAPLSEWTQIKCSCARNSCANLSSPSQQQQNNHLRQFVRNFGHWKDFPKPGQWNVLSPWKLFEFLDIS